MAATRWLPVRRNQIRSDGLAYAYAEPYKANPTDTLVNATRIHVVSLPNGGDRVIYSGAPRIVVAYETEGIYISAVRYYAGEGSSGLWRLDPGNGATTEIPSVHAGFIEAVEHGIAWTDGGGITPRALTRLDLSSAGQEEWAYVGDEGWIWFVGLDSRGNPLVVLFSGPSTSPGVLFVYTAPTVRVPIASVSFTQLSVTDSHGTWLAGLDGIYLLDADDKLTKVSDMTGGTIAGACD